MEKFTRRPQCEVRNRSLVGEYSWQRPREDRVRLSLTNRSPDGSSLTVPCSVRGARLRVKHCPLRIPRIFPAGAVLSGPAGVAGGGAIGAASVTDTTSPADGTSPALLAFKVNVPACSKRTV